MQNEFFQIILYILSIYIVGFIPLMFFFRNFLVANNLFINTAVAWMLGNFISMTILSLLAFTNNLHLVTSTTFYMWFILSFISVFGGGIVFRKTIFPISLKNLIILLLLLIFFLPLIKDALFSYLIAWDGMAIWFMKAKSFFFSSGVNDNLFFKETAHFAYAHSGYPNGVPLMLAGFYRIIGYVNDQIVQLYLLTFFINIVFVFFGSTHQLFSKLSSISKFLIILSMSLIPSLIIYSHNGYVDVALSFVILLVAALFLLKNQNIFLIILAASLGALIKNEGYAFLFFTLIISFLYYLKIVKQKNSAQLIFIVILSLIPLVGWHIVKTYLQLPADAYLENAGIHSGMLSRLKVIFPVYIAELTNISKVGILLIPFILTFILQATILGINRQILLLVPTCLLLLQFAAYSVIYLITSIPVQWQVESSFDRLLLHLQPTLFLLVLFYIKPSIDLLKKTLNK